MAELIQALYEGKTIRHSFTGKNRRRKWMAVGGITAGCIGLIAACIFLPLYFRQSSSQDSTAASEPAELWTEEPSSVEEAAADSTETGTNLVQEEDAEVIMDMEVQVEELGPQVVWPEPETMIAAGFNHILSLREDGTVLSAGNNIRGQCEVGDWDHVAAVYASYQLSAGLRTDGSVVVAGSDYLQESVASWRGVRSLALGRYHILGLLEDGTVISAGYGSSECCDTGDWTDIESVWAEGSISVGITRNGEVRLAGDATGEEELWERVRQWTDVRKIVMAVEGGTTFYGVFRDGTVLCAGRNEEFYGQPVDASGIRDVAVGDGFLVGLREDGTLTAFTGDINSQKEEISTWSDIAALTGTMYHVAALRRDGMIQVTEPSRYGSSTLEEILALENAVQAVWEEQSLSVLCSDGTVRIAGYKPYYFLNKESENQGEDWTDIARLATYQVGLAGITFDGKIRISDAGVARVGDGLSGEELWERVNQTPDLTAEWENVKDISCSESHIAALLEDGTVKAAGFAFDQMTTDYLTGLTTDGACETDDWTEIRQVIAIKVTGEETTEGETIGLREDGTLVSTREMPEEWAACTDLAGIWTSGQAVAAVRRDGSVQYLRVWDDKQGQTNVAGWKDIRELALSRHHTVGLKTDGTVVATGSNFCGQCEVDGWTDIVAISAGPTATIGITSEGKVMMAGTLPDDYFVAEQWPAVSIEDMVRQNP